MSIEISRWLLLSLVWYIIPTSLVHYAKYAAKEALFALSPILLDQIYLNVNSVAFLLTVSCAVSARRRRGLPKIHFFVRVIKLAIKAAFWPLGVRLATG